MSLPSVAARQFPPTPARHQSLPAAYARPHPSTRTRRTLASTSPLTLACDRHYTPAPALHTSTHQKAAHRCPTPARHQPLRAGSAHPHPSRRTRRPSLPCTSVPPTHARTLRSPPRLHTKTTPIAVPPLHAAKPCAPTALTPTPPHPRDAHLCPAPGRHQPMRADCAGRHSSTRSRRSSLPRPCSAPTPARRLRSTPPLHTTTPPIAATPLHATNP